LLYSRTHYHAHDDTEEDEYQYQNFPPVHRHRYDSFPIYVHACIINSRNIESDEDYYNILPAAPKSLPPAAKVGQQLLYAHLAGGLGGKYYYHYLRIISEKTGTVCNQLI
jgi:hypothetical protein